MSNIEPGYSMIHKTWQTFWLVIHANVDRVILNLLMQNFHVEHWNAWALHKVVHLRILNRICEYPLQRRGKTKYFVSLCIFLSIVWYMCECESFFIVSYFKKKYIAIHKSHLLWGITILEHYNTMFLNIPFPATRTSTF